MKIYTLDCLGRNIEVLAVKGKNPKYRYPDRNDCNCRLCRMETNPRSHRASLRSTLRDASYMREHEDCEWAFVLEQLEAEGFFK